VIATTQGSVDGFPPTIFGSLELRGFSFLTSRRVMARDARCSHVTSAAVVPVPPAPPAEVAPAATLDEPAEPALATGAAGSATVLDGDAEASVCGSLTQPPEIKALTKQTLIVRNTVLTSWIDAFASP
jgi:hypothetical protein